MGFITIFHHRLVGIFLELLEKASNMQIQDESLIYVMMHLRIG